MLKPRRKDFASQSAYEPHMRAYAKYLGTLTPVREVLVEVIREVPVEDRETRAKLEATEARLQALRDELNASRVKSEAAVEAIPPDLQDLFRETDAHGDKAAELLRRYNELTNKIMMNIATDTERKMQERLHGGLSWLQRKAVEVI